MNQYFSSRPPNDFVFPSKVYARLEGVEFPAIEGAAAIMRFDAVDAAWLNGQKESLFNLKAADISAAAWAAWLSRASEDNGIQGQDDVRPPDRRPYPDPLQDAPISSITLAVDYKIDVWCQQLGLPESVRRKKDPGPEFIAALQKRWYLLELTKKQSGANNAKLYRWILDEGIHVFAASMPLPVPSATLSAMTSLAGLPVLTNISLQTIMQRVSADYLAIYDVGQANANALLEKQLGGHAHVETTPSVYYDLGIPTKANLFTKPAGLKFCFTSRPPIVLSHWHEDHLGGIALPSYAVSPEQCAWIVPDHSASFKHAAMITGILVAGGSITVIPKVPPNTVYTCSLGPTRTMHLSRGKAKDPNGSGIVMAITNEHPARRKLGKIPLWLLTGDCGLRHFNPALKALISAIGPNRIQAMVAPHHGGYLPKTAAAIPSTGGYQRLIYSFGRNNTHTHATDRFVTRHHAAGWVHPIVAAAPTVDTACQDILATNVNAPCASAPGGAVVSWSAACPSVSPLCTGSHCTAPLTKS